MTDLTRPTGIEINIRVRNFGREPTDDLAMSFRLDRYTLDQLIGSADTLTAGQLAIAAVQGVGESGLRRRRAAFLLLDWVRAARIDYAVAKAISRLACDEPLPPHPELPVAT